MELMFCLLTVSSAKLLLFSILKMGSSDKDGSAASTSAEVT
jgi:hypothetical protein